jgi:hypothetical protein
MDQKTIYQDRLGRLRRAIDLAPQDRTPVVLEYSGFAPFVTGTPMSDFLTSPAAATRTMISAWDMIGGGDGINYGSFSIFGLSRAFGAKIKIPGTDLPDNEMWQVVETELLLPEDYDRIVAEGWPAFSDRFFEEKIFKDIDSRFRPPYREAVDVRGSWAEKGAPVLTGGDITTPIEFLCGARSLPQFARDLYYRPDRIEAAMEEMAPYMTASVIERAKKNGYPGVWVGGWRAAPEILAPRMWDRFVWPYFRQAVQEVVAADLLAVLHLDSSWDRELARFLELPAQKCVLATDGRTDLLRAKDILGHHMCLMGDVPATMFCLDPPEKVHAYCRHLIETLGPEGFILQSGCDIPANAKLENVRAMVRAVRME